MLTAVVGINWGDEGKGRMVDLLSQEQDIVVRYQGGNNAGHTVVNDRGAFVLNLLPSGILRENVVNILGGGMVIDLEHLHGEVARLREAGIAITPENLKISDRAIICMPWHKQTDIMEETRLGDRMQGSTRRGIGPVYADKYLRKGIQIGELLTPGYLRTRLEEQVEWKNITLAKAYGVEPFSLEDALAWLEAYGDAFRPFICDTGAYLGAAAAQNKRILFEAQLGALRDIDFGIYPFTSSSSTIAAYAPIGAGIPGQRLDQVVGIMKAYSSSVGGGPFVCEMFGEAGSALREAGSEYGAATGRPRRVGGFDIPASRYGVRVQGATSLALTKLDVLDTLAEIPVCVRYDIDGGQTEDFPNGARLERAKPVIEYLPGWQRDISACRTEEALPDNARRYIEYLEQAVGCHIEYVSVGASREQYLTRR